jgi:ParB-like chromosome segregation protein Spo0J
LVDGEQGIIAGHARVLASRKLGIAEIPTIELAYLSAAQRKAYIIADNKLAENAGWDTELLGLELRDLKELGFELPLVGFNDFELNSLLAANGLGTGGDAPVDEIAEKWAVIVECVNEVEQIELIQRLQAEGRKVRGSIG